MQPPEQLAIIRQTATETPITDHVDIGGLPTYLPEDVDTRSAPSHRTNTVYWRSRDQIWSQRLYLTSEQSRLVKNADRRKNENSQDIYVPAHSSINLVHQWAGFTEGPIYIVGPAGGVSTRLFVGMGSMGDSHIVP